MSADEAADGGNHDVKSWLKLKIIADTNESVKCWRKFVVLWVILRVLVLIFIDFELIFYRKWF